ncbi:hypothetical protein AQI88_22020 [Streptomyces cellostaticus]|uniref:Lipoprotein n=1 Tax=Streptomyces cellostaticus TaxID=67285 RepID=A0A117PVN1_9ACTN|nr:hypothetical protein [Streptomyces cellostaticus]KUM94385.1 hypothetical protein AQI88_22020 [Streptomyces cellostaticus]GHI07129.1 hypothetical protein Scel_54500 [Streptomyces cellostaticus]
MGMKGKIALSAVVGVVVIGVVSANAGSSGKDSSASAAHQPGGKKDSEGAKAAEKKKAAFGGDGDFRVGSDVKPGTYRTTGNADDQCSWERAKDASGETDSLLANDNVTGTSYVTVKAGDKLFKSSGCKDWEAVDPKAKGTPASSMDGDGGMFRVGADIAPGTYRSTGNADDSCYWERTKDAEHGLDSVIANDNVTGTAVVTIRSTDAYFKTTGCGDWKKTG